MSSFEGGAGAARKVVRDPSAVFSFASRNEIVVRNPCDTAAVRKTDNQNERFLTLEEVTRLGSALDELEQDGVNPKALNIARLWALTGCRRDEIAGLKWPEVNLEEGLLELDDSKTGKSVRPLGAAALALLKSIDKSGRQRLRFSRRTWREPFSGHQDHVVAGYQEGSSSRRNTAHIAAHDGVHRDVNG